MQQQTIATGNLKFTHSGEFGKEIRKRVNHYFKDNKISRKGDWRLFSKAIILFTLFFVDYYFLLYFDVPPWLRIILWILLVPICAGIGFSVMHDANHGAFSKHSWANKLAGWSLNFLGANNHIWKKKHNEIHHHGTNVNHIDEDIEAKPLLRLHDEQPRYWIHKYQHWYWPLAYGLLYFSWVFVKDFYKYFSGKIMNKKITFAFWEHVNFWASKAFFYLLFIHVPIKQIGFNSWLIGFGIFAALLGFVISTVFQLAHIVEGLNHPTFEEADGTESVEHQISTTANFAPHNKFINWWVGGLNFQIEHHLFFGVSHVHYPEIHKIVKSTAEEYQFPLVVFPTIKSAVLSHVAKLKEFGKKPK